MGRNLILTVGIDYDVEQPDSGYDGWKLVSFGRKHANHEESAKYVKAFDRRTMAVTPASIGLAKKLNVGLAFWLAYYEHGLGAWSLIGEGPQCPWDTAPLAGVLLWTGKPGDIGAKTLDDRAEDARNFLESFNDWANGNCYWFRLADESGEEIEGFGGLIGDEAVSEVVGEVLEAGDNLMVEGDAAWLKNHLQLPEGVRLVDRFADEVEEGDSRTRHVTGHDRRQPSSNPAGISLCTLEVREGRLSEPDADSAVLLAEATGERQMAHEIETMAYFGRLPWHGLGTALEEADLYDWQAASKKAGLDWSVDLVPLVTADTQAQVAHKAVRRSTDNKVLGIVGPRYAPLQNQDAFKWFTPFLDAKEAALHTAGSLRGGSRVWVLAKLNRAPLVIAEGDEIEKFVLLSHGHDGSLAVRAGFTPIRVVCQNTSSMAHGCDASKLIRVRHTGSVLENLANIRAVMDLANQEFEATAEQYRLLARKSVNAADLRKYVKRVLKIDEEPAPSTRSLNIVEEIVRLAESGRGNDLPSVRGTLWTAYNGVSEYLTVNRGRSADNRLNSLWFGDGLNATATPWRSHSQWRCDAQARLPSGAGPAGRHFYRQLRGPAW